MGDGGFLPPKRRMSKETKKSTKKIINNIRAISIDIISMPVKPKTPATSARIKNVITQSNITIPLLKQN